jgi:acyl-CoA oxidase
MDFRSEDGTLLGGITIEDMGRKTVGNDLDNVSIHFNKVELPRSAMLSKFAEIDENGEYKLLVPGIKPFDMIG